MSNAPDRSFTHDHVLREDGIVEFRCSTDREEWPWLKLHPHHPASLQAVNFWATAGASMAMGTFDPEKWSALTWTKWESGEGDVGQPVRGTMDRGGTDEKMEFKLDFFDGDDRLVYRMQGKGVIFRTRDFPAWRSEAKKQAGACSAEATFEFAPHPKLGVAEIGLPFLSRLEHGASGGMPRAAGLITAGNGMPPGHPYISGSGDHVNSSHQAEVATQFAALLNNGAPFRVISGEMRFTHYVELGVPFAVQLTEQTEGSISMELRQNETLCSVMTLGFERV